MEQNEVTLRPALPEDAEAMLAIYAPYVQKTAITFEYEVPSPAEFRGRMERTLARYPWLAAEREGEVIGYAYTGPFSGRAAYDWSAETSIYLGEASRRQGIGRRLYRALEEISRAQGIVNLCACISVPPGEEDEHLTRASVRFHQRLGYRLAGEFRQCGYKFGRWYNMVWMEKHIAPHPAAPSPVIPFPELDPGIWEKA